MTTPDTQRTVLVTGAAGGLGRAFARAFAEQGDRVVLADRDPAGVTAAAAEQALKAALR